MRNFISFRNSKACKYNFTKKYLANLIRYSTYATKGYEFYSFPNNLGHNFEIHDKTILWLRISFLTTEKKLKLDMPKDFF